MPPFRFNQISEIEVKISKILSSFLKDYEEHNFNDFYIYEFLKDNGVHFTKGDYSFLDFLKRNSNPFALFLKITTDAYSGDYRIVDKDYIGSFGEMYIPAELLKEF